MTSPAAAAVAAFVPLAERKYARRVTVDMDSFMYGYHYALVHVVAGGSIQNDEGAGVLTRCGQRLRMGRLLGPTCGGARVCRKCEKWTYMQEVRAVATPAAAPQPTTENTTMARTQLDPAVVLSTASALQAHYAKDARERTDSIRRTILKRTDELQAKLQEEGAGGFDTASVLDLTDALHRLVTFLQDEERASVAFLARLASL